MSRCEDALWDHIDRGDNYCHHDEGHTEALRRRREGKATMWSSIGQGHDAGGDRDFLDGRAIHCGTTIELQAVEERYDDYGSYTVYLDRGEPVRYEMAWLPTAPRKVIYLHAQIGGWGFMARHEPWMRFRWPGKGR